MTEPSNFTVALGGRVLVKPGVTFDVIAPAGYQILSALKTTAKAMGLALTITSACDGEHSGPDDPHKWGLAYDVRSHDLDPAVRPQVLHVLMTTLGSTFYGFLEDPNTSNEHFHVQARHGQELSISEWLAA